MKKTRHRKIVEIIEKKDVETQEELGRLSEGSRICGDPGNSLQGHSRIEIVQSSHRRRKTEICHSEAG